jgi:hypothetical protein
MESGQTVYFIRGDSIEKAKLLFARQSIWVVELDGEILRIQEDDCLTDDTNEVAQYIDKRISKYEARLAVLKAKRQEFQPLRLK